MEKLTNSFFIGNHINHLIKKNKNKKIHVSITEVTKLHGEINLQASTHFILNNYYVLKLKVIKKPLLISLSNVYYILYYFYL